MNRLDAALMDYNKAIKLKDHYLNARNNRAALLNKMGQYSSAIENAQAILQIDPDFRYLSIRTR